MENMPLNHKMLRLTICHCRKGESGKMIQCDNIYCEIGWYHYHCLNIPDDFEPMDDEEWFCPDCESKQCHI